MSERIEDKKIVLCLNRQWIPIGECCVKDALISMCSGNDFLKAAVALDIKYDKDENGQWDFSKASIINPCPWNDWIKLDIPDYREAIHTSKMAIRVPTIIISTRFDKIPMKKLRPTKSGIWERDKGICQYSGKKLNRKDSNIDHILPVSRSGKDTWENMVLCDKKINTMKGNRLNSEVGLILIREPKKPVADVPAWALITEAKNMDWKHFLMQK